MTSSDERDPSWGPPLGGNPTEAAADLVVDVDEPDELLLDPVEADLVLLPEQWEVLPDLPLLPSPPSAALSATDPPVVAEPPVAVPVLQHVVEAEPELEPEPEPEPEVVETESDFVFAPQPEPALQTVIQPPPVPVAAPPPAPVAASPPRRGLDAELVPPAERATSALVLLLLAVVVGIAVAGLVSAVVLVITLVVRRALGA